MDLARVSSLDYQQRFCIHGTVSEYCLLDELLDTTLFAIRQYADHSNCVSQREKESLLRFHIVADEFADRIPWQDSKISIQQIVEHDAMEGIREAANRCLRDLDATFSREELFAG